MRFVIQNFRIQFVLLALVGLTTSPSWALDSYDLLGTWVVESVSPQGMIPQTVQFTKMKEGTSGIWRVLSNWTGLDSKIEDLKLRNASLSFRVGDGADSRFWTGQFHQKDQITMTWIDTNDGHLVQTRIFRRISPAQLAELQANAPANLITQKSPLPALQELPTNGLALPPPMGWNSWNHFEETIDDKAVREMAEALVLSGLRDAGYVYVNIDDGWQGRRDERGILRPNSKFPDMKTLADYVHARGLKLGIYNSPGPMSCAGYVGSHGHEAEDAQTFAAWGIDFFKYDWCSAGSIYTTQSEMQALYQKMGAALRATGRPIVYSLCQYGLFDVGSWGRTVGGNLWRTGDDTIEGQRWASLSARFESNGKPEYNGPGGWNDPDMMLIGNGGLTAEEYRTHMTLWAMLAAPLIIGNDLRTMTAEVKSILLNRDVIAIDQDSVGKQGRRIVKHGTAEVWTKPLSDGATAVAVFNRGEAAVTLEAIWSELGFANGQRVRDLWKQRDLGNINRGYKATIPRHGSVLLKVMNIN